MKLRKQLDGIVRARSAAASSLLEALKSLHEKKYSEKDVSLEWLSRIMMSGEVASNGWYTPPPSGVSVLIGHSPDYTRLNYESLRSKENWPQPDIRFEENSIIYPYFSAVDKQTNMIGDHVATYYSGANKEIQDWYREIYEMTRSLAFKAKQGMSFSELYNIADLMFNTIGVQNNTFSINGGLASDIGHTVPYFGQEHLESIDIDNEDNLKLLSNDRKFISKESNYEIGRNCAFTIEPQAILGGLPMASFHVIIVFFEGELYLVEKFKDLFDYFGMSKWIYSNNRKFNSLS